MGNIKFSELTEKTAPHKDDLLVIADMENDLSKSVKYSTIRPYKVYSALLTQTGTSAPVATVLENTLSGAVVWTRDSVGIYIGTLSGAFTENKTFLIIGTKAFTEIESIRLSDNEVRLATYYPGDTEADDKLTLTPLEIRVYN